MTCRVCGNPVPAGRRTICSKACEDEYNRRANRAAYYIRKGIPVPEKKQQQQQHKVRLPPGQWFRAVCPDDDESADWLPPNREYSREAVLDFVQYGAKVEWFQRV